ncbi:MAG: nucleotidyltransferase [Oscillospiraceae bacterium]|nr:nucleotidyltransferase [Oscillospiraceae bacterium]
MQEPTLVILAAGMGSRFGGLKQITAVDENKHAIIDFSLFDAYRAGFKKVAFIIKHQIEEDFKAAVGKRMEKYFDVKYVYQELDKLPEGYSIPEGRVKPWGTGHAVMCCKDVIDGPFAVINADDFYGPSAYTSLYNFLSEDKPSNEHAMVAYMLNKTVTENGSVARGICQVENGYLTDVVETLGIVKDGENGAYPDENGNMLPLSGDSPVSMNCWGFGKDMLSELWNRFPKWLDENLSVNPMKCEYFLPFVANSLIKDKAASVKILNCSETWYGITYKEDMQSVVDAIANMRKQGIYPEALLD